jgi:hypothetical protein
MASSCAKPAIAKKRLSQEEYAPQPKEDAEGNTRYRHEGSGEEQLRGQFAERCPWFTFAPVILADFLAGDNRETP